MKKFIPSFSLFSFSSICTCCDCLIVLNRHQSLNNGSFPSLNLTHKEVGGSFYTIREIVREIIQENRVLGTSDLILDGKGDDHLQDQTLSSSVLMDPVPPLSLSPEGFHSLSGQSHNLSEDRGSDVLKDMEVNGYKHCGEDVGLLAHEPVVSANVSRTQFAGSCSEENDIKHDAGLLNRVQTVCDSFASKPQDKEVEVDKKDRGFEETPFIEPNGTKHVNVDEGVNDDEAAMMTERVNMRKNTLGTIDFPAEEAVVVETFSITSVASSTMELAKVCEGGNGTEAKVESDSSTETSVDLGETFSSISAAPEEKETEVIGVQMPNQISISMEKKVEEKTVNSSSVCADTKGTVVENAVISSIHETKEFSNGSLTNEQTTPTSGTEVSFANHMFCFYILFESWN